jgi:hypothetical protein
LAGPYADAEEDRHAREENGWIEPGRGEPEDRQREQRAERARRARYEAESCAERDEVRGMTQQEARAGALDVLT